MLPTLKGIHRAERLICCFFEERNHRKAVNQLGEVDYVICHTEKLLLLNSYALSVGCREHDLPYNVSAPRQLPSDEKEYMGFSHAAAANLVADHVSNPAENNAATVKYGSDDNNEEDDVANDVEEEPDAHRDGDALLGHILGDDLDIEVFATEEEYNNFVANQGRTKKSVDNPHHLDELDKLTTLKDRENCHIIEQELRKLLPVDTGGESTIAAFQRLTNQFAWIPFRDPDSTSPSTEIDQAEAALFDDWMSAEKYNINATSGPWSFKAFERDWNNEVTRRFRLWSRQNETDVVQLRYKSKLQLQRFFMRKLISSAVSRLQTRIIELGWINNCAT